MAFNSKVKPKQSSKMAHLTAGERTYIKQVEEFGYVSRPFLGLSNSAVVTCDDGRYLGFAGQEATVELVDAQTGKDGQDQTVPIPTDFRTAGIAIMNSLSIPEATQVAMFQNFMNQYTKEQRAAFVSQYDALDHNDPVAVQAFVDAMMAMLVPST
jgi:hypothetical protein